MRGPQTTASPRTRYWIGALLVFLAAFCFALK
ncbi:MAG: EamA/RhaT family transporter, partial [Flavobacterium sp.]